MAVGNPGAGQKEVRWFGDKARSNRDPGASAEQSEKGLSGHTKGTIVMFIGVSGSGKVEREALTSGRLLAFS